LLFQATKTNNGDTGWELRIIEYLTGTMARPRIQDHKKEEEDSESESQSGYRYIYRQQLANSLVSWDMGGKTEDGIEAGIGPRTSVMSTSSTVVLKWLFSHQICLFIAVHST